MKDHEKSSVIVDSTAVGEIVTEKVKTEGSLGERDEEGEDMMVVDVVGADSVDSDRKADSVGLVEERKEMEPRDLNTGTKDGGAGSVEEDVCCVPAGTKGEVTVNEERLETSTEVRDCEMAVEPKGSILEQNVESVEVVEERIQKEKEVSDLNTDVEEAAAPSGEDVCRDSVGSGGLAFEKVEVTAIEEGLDTSLEVSKDVLQGNDDATACGSLVQDSKESSIGEGDSVVMDSKDLTERGSTEEEHVEHVEEVAEGDCVLGKKPKKEAEISDSSKIAESLEVDTVVVEDEAEKSVYVDPSLVSANNENSSTELVNVETDEVAGNSKEESPHPTVEVITDDSQGKESVEPRFVGGENDLIDKEEESDRGLPKDVTEQPMESDQQVGDGDRVLDEKIVKESEVLDSSKVSEPRFVGENYSIDKEEESDKGLPKDVTEQPMECDQQVGDGDRVLDEKIVKESEVLDSSKVSEPRFVGENYLIDKEEESDKSLPKDVTEQPMECDQQVVDGDRVLDEKIVKESVVLDSSKVSEPRFVGENVLIDKEEESDRGLLKDVTEQPMECDQQVADGDRVLGEKIVKESEALDSSKVSEPRFVGGEDDSIDKEEESDRGLPNDITEQPVECDQQVTDGDRVLDEKIVKESEALDSSKVSEPRFVGGEDDSIDKVEESDRGLPKETTEQPMEYDQQVADGDRVLDHKIVKESEPLDSSKVSEPPTATNPGSEDVDVVVVDEGLATKDEAQDGVFVDPSSVSADNRSSPTKVVVAQAENVDQQAEVVPNDAQNPENGTGVGDSKSGVDSSVQVGVHGDVVMDEKTRKQDEVLDSSKIPESLTTDNLVPKEVLTTKVESQDGDSASQKLVPESNHDLDGQHVDQLVGPENSQMEKMVIENKQSSVAEMLSQLHSVAQDPMKGSASLNTIKSFFYDHRAVGRPVSVRKRKTSNENEPEEFESDDVNDSYWTDRIVQNHPEEQLVQDNQNGGQERHIVAYEPDKPAKANRRSNKKRFMFSNHEMGLKEQSELVERRRQNLATEVVLKFPMGIYFPSEIHLNKMFRRFGALMESETEVDRQNGRARVVFKKCCDAEVAHSSAGKFNIFGPINVNYELNYNPLVSYKPLLLSVLQDSMDTS